MGNMPSTAGEFLQTLIGKHIQIRLATEARDRDIFGTLLADYGDRLVVEVNETRPAMIYTANILMIMESERASKMRAPGVGVGPTP